MRTNTRWAVMTGLSFLLLACAGEEEVETAEIEAVGADAPVVPPAPMDTGMAMAGMGTTVQMQPLNNSGITGEATLSEQGGQVQVMVRLTGSQPNVTHQGHIHQGTCDNLGSVVAPLEPVTTGADGSGTSTSTVSPPMMTIMNGQHVVNYHEAGGSPGQPVSCGAIPAHQM